MESSSITSWQIEGKKCKQWQIFFSWAPKLLQMVIAAIKLKDICSLEGSIAGDSLLSEPPGKHDKTGQHIKKQRHHFANKGPIVKTIGFPVVLYRWENFIVKKAEHQRIDAFEPWCWRRLSRVPWTARRSNQSILKEISPEYPLERLMLKLKLQYFGHLMQRTNSLERPWCWERLKAGKGGDRG